VVKKRTWLYHILFWAIIYALWVVVFRSYSFSLTKTMTIEFCYLIFITADYYIVSNLIVPQFLLKKKYVLFVVATILAILFSAWLRALVAVQMNLHFYHITPDFLTLYLNSVLNISFWVLIITTGKMLIDRIQNQRQLELLEKEKTKNELDFLKAQINPHALFNSLNTIYGHIDKSNQVARNTLLQFSELLRYQLYDCSAEKVDLEKEIAYIKNYIAFQQLRKEDNLIVELEINNNAERLQIAPLLLIVLIENAFKFASNSAGKEHKVRLKLTAGDDFLHCYILNTIEPDLPTRGKGSIGIANLKRRLELLYPGKYVFASNKSLEYYETHLRIDLS
jgi:two-component system, LytTR family, sensor kinase